MDQTFAGKLKARCYSEVPVWVVEDHNDVLPHIYRAIASRHLPFQGVTMLHFDSHPDLQIATEMDADTVFDRLELFSSLSIENWILPAVYAGHIGGVVWIKPPWADQLPEGSRRVAVGKHTRSKKLRISWPDSYFLSDLLYAPEEDMESAKELDVDVITMVTELLPIASRTSPFTDQNHGSSVPSDEIRTTSQCNLNKETLDISQTTEANDHQGLSSGVSSCDHDTVNSPHGKTSFNHEGQSGDCHESITGKPARGGSLEIANSGETSNGMKRKRSMAEHPHSPSGNLCGLHDVTGAAMEKGSGTVLDIDLDFFSTRNPFKEMYSQFQFRLLEELYSYEGPADESESALAECMLRRADQLSQLETALKAAVSGQERAETVSQERFQKVQSLVESLRATSTDDSEPIDAEMIHMAGLTCDNSGELPHHVSSEEEIHSLVAAMETLLSRLPRPVMVTVARSSHDDYCPPEQVDQIQQKVLRMLQNVYGKVAVHLDYKNEEENSDKTSATQC
ncbi:UPF0489 protein C5orf22 homolog [Patiria miniata]|uniref:Uncharacterized protein n=1 Tax=Patiria miniata TaxID=46514 RepID=A0A914B187_PATMI|nr:UPF0489 protein C5orf22 homolog [Patiria miniata]